MQMRSCRLKNYNKNNVQCFNANYPRLGHFAFISGLICVFCCCLVENYKFYGLSILIKIIN